MRPGVEPRPPAPRRHTLAHAVVERKRVVELGGVPGASARAFVRIGVSPALIAGRITRRCAAPRKCFSIARSFMSPTILSIDGDEIRRSLRRVIVMERKEAI